MKSKGAQYMDKTILQGARDLLTVASYDQPTEAFIMQGCLVASGIPAVVADAELNQVDSLLTPALGGVRIRVPEEYLHRAEEVIAAFHQGAFALPDDVDVGDAAQ
jgi:Zn-dependent alcohol dehydrogenase